jgi:hypothetical protein
MNSRIKQVYYQYHLWEDYLNGMYITPCDIKEVDIVNCISLLCNPNLFYSVMNEVIDNWKYSSAVNLTNVNCNRQAWLGAAACCYYYGQPEVVTRLAWNQMSKNKQDIANNVADKIIKLYEAKNNELHKGLGNEMLF